MAKRSKMPPAEYFTELWRPHPDFVGPSMPPMIAWQRAGEPEDAWRRPKSTIAANLFDWAGVSTCAA